MSTAVLIPGPPSKRIKSECILCNDTCDEIRTFTQDQWEKFEQTALKWKALDKYGDVYDRIKWERGPTGPQSIFHRHCVSYMQTSKKLEQAENRLKKRDAAPTPSLLNEPDVSVQENPEESVSTAPRRSTRVSLGKIYDKTLCIWCMKPDEKLKKKKGGDKDSEFHRIEQNKPWRHFCAATPYYLDPLMRERILGLIAATPKDDPFAADIHYHKKCWDKYVSNPNRRRRHSAQNVTMEEATAVFILHIQNTVFDLNEPQTLQGLVLDYRDILFELGQEDKEPKTSSIKSLLMEEFGDSVGFHERYQKNKSTLVYDCSNGGSFLESAINSWGLSLEELLKNVARRINEQAKSLPQMQWPPTINEVSADTSENFLTLFVGWLKSPNDKEEKTSKSPHVYVIASLLQSLITKKRTNLQVLLTNLIYGLTRSRELVDITKKLGLGISYQDIKNLYSTWAKLDVEKGTCPPQIAETFPAVVIMDNDDFKSDTLTGTSVSNHRTNVMFVQSENLLNSASSLKEKLTLVTPNALKNIVDDLNKIRPYKTTKKCDPAIRQPFDIKPSSTTDIRSDEILHSLVRISENYENIDPQDQGIGSFAGFQSLLNEEVTKSKPYYWLTFPKPPHKSVVHEIMTRLLDVIKEKSLPFVLLTGDQPVYTLIVQIRNECDAKFEKIIPILGPFHTQVAFITAIAKRFEGSGLSDILVSADIIADKSVDQAFRGKHYRRIVRALQLMYEALQRRIIRRGIEGGLNLSENLMFLLERLRNHQEYSKDQLIKTIKNIKKSSEFQDFIQQAYDMIESTPMAKYWLSFMDMVEILVTNIHSLKTRNWKQFKDSLRRMVPWLQLYDKIHYGKWLSEFWMEISNLPDDIDTLMPSIFSHSITGKPYSSIPTNLWIEMTMNKGSKMKAGWQRILGNETLLCVHIRCGNYINQLRMSLHTFSEMKSYKSGHKENTATRLRLDELGVHDLDSCIVEFNCDPFDPNNIHLRTLQSGQYASEEVEDDLLSAQEDGEKKVLEFFKERIFSREKEWGINKNYRKTFLTTPASEKASKTKCNTAEMENEALSRVISEYCGKDITLSDILQHRITTECLSLFNTNGTIIKNQKSKLLQSFSYVPMQFEELRNYAAIVDMGFIWRLCSPSPEDREKRDESAFTWRDYAVKIFGTVMSRHASATTIIFVNDPYDVEESIKAGEHARREAHQYVCGSKNVFIRPLEALPNKRNLSNFFTSKSNKIRLQEFLKNEFCRLSMSHGEKTLIYCVQRSCEDLKTKMRLSAYECHHQEADTNLFYVTHVLRQSGFTNAIVIDAEDTDVVVQSSLVVKEIDGYLGIRKKKSTFNCEQLCGPDLASVILQIHVLTGADATSGFFGRGKKTVINHALKNIEDTQKLLGDLGKSLVLTYEVYRNVMMFVIHYVYNDKKSFTLADLRSLIWKRMKKKSTQRIPPDEDSLRLHIKRCNYVVHMCLNYKSPDPPPSPRYHGWELIDGECSPIRYEKPALPESMTQPAATETMENNENSDNDSEDDDDIIKASDDEDTDGNETEREYENSGDEY